MKRSILWTWAGAAAIGVGLAATASADPWDRDHEVGRMRAAEFRQSVAARDSSARPSMERSVSGREMGRDTIERGSFRHEFRDRNDMMGHVNTATKMRAERTVAARGDEDAPATGAFPNAGRPLTSPVEFQAKAVQEKRGSAPIMDPSEAMTPHEEQILKKSTTGREIGHDTLGVGDAYVESKNRNEMMSKLNTQTTIRATRTAAATGGEDADKSQTFANAGHHTSDPSKLTDAQRKELSALGFSGAAKRQSSADVEDKAK